MADTYPTGFEQLMQQAAQGAGSVGVGGEETVPSGGETGFEPLDDWLAKLQQESAGPEYPDKPASIADQIYELPNSDKLQPSERWLYGKLAGFPQSSVGKALTWFSNTTAGKILGYLDVFAEGLERTLGVIEQYATRDPDEEFSLKDAWSAGSLFYDVANLPKLAYDENGNLAGVRIDDDLPGAYALAEARKMIHDGASLEEVREKLYDNLGALAIRSQVNDTLGHILLDPLNFLTAWLKPVSKMHALRNLAIAGKLDVRAARATQQALKAAGRLEDAAEVARAIEKAKETGRAMTRFDRFVIAMTGGTEWLEQGGKISPARKFLEKINPFALTPEAKASELRDIIMANIGEYLVRPNWNKDPDAFIEAVSAASRGAIGSQWGHIAVTTQGRVVQGFLAHSEAAIKVLGHEWKLWAKERGLLQRLVQYLPDMDEIKIRNLAVADPAALAERLARAGVTDIGEDIIRKLGEIPKDVPITREMFYAKAMSKIEDVAMRQAVLRFGIKEKGIIRKWSDALKSVEALPFIRLNPANAIRNYVSNEVHMIARGVFGTMTPGELKKFWKGKYIPDAFQRGFGIASEGIEESTEEFQHIVKALEGKGTSLPQRISRAVKGAKLPFDLSTVSQKLEKAASLRASTNGYLEFIHAYWRPKTGYTSAAKFFDPADLERMESIRPGITKLLDDAVQSAGADSEKLAKAIFDNLEHSPAAILSNAEDAIGYKLDDVLGADTLHLIKEGLPEAIKKGTVREFIAGIEEAMERNVDEMFSEHLKNLPGIVANQVAAGGPVQFPRILAKSLDDFWGGNLEHAMRMASVNYVMDAARRAGDYKKVGALWNKIFSETERHFGRVWKKFEAYQEGLKEGARLAGVPYPAALDETFQGIRKGWGEFFEFRNAEYKRLFAQELSPADFKSAMASLQVKLDDMYAGMMKQEDALFQKVDDLLVDSVPEDQRVLYMTLRDEASRIRQIDRQSTAGFIKKVRDASSDEAPDLWQKYWADRMARLEQMRQLEQLTSAVLQGDPESIAKALRMAGITPPAEAKNIFELARSYGIASATASGARNDRRILNTVNKYLPDGAEKYKSVADIPLDVARQAFEQRRLARVAEGKSLAFMPDAEKIIPDPVPVESGLAQMFYGRSYAALDTIIEEATKQAPKSTKLAVLPDDLRKKVMAWVENVNGEMSGFRAAAVQYAAFRRDSALLNYSRRTNFDTWLGTLAPFSFWYTHSMANWVIHSLDRPAMVTTYFRLRQFFETAGLPEQKVPTRLKGQIRVKMPFAPDWMGDTFVNPMRFLLPFDGFLMPWERATSERMSEEAKVRDTLAKMLEDGEITDEDYQEAVNTKSGGAWERARMIVRDGGESYDAMDFVAMAISPHAPLMWAYNAARGTPNEIGPFTPMSRTAHDLATVLGVNDWSNSPYNLEGKIRRELGLPAYDKWEDYRISREISNIAGDGNQDIEKVKEAMVFAALVESGKMEREDAIRESPLYAEAVRRANMEMTGGVGGAVLRFLGIPLNAYPTGEQAQRKLADEFRAAMEKSRNGDEQALADFFDKHPEYESRLALFKKPEERLKQFQIDAVWDKWNSLPKVTRDELMEQMGDAFRNNFISSDLRNYDAITPEQLNIWLKLMGAETIGKLSATEEAMIELNQLKLTDPETAWRVQTFYDMRNQEFPGWYEMQQAYYSLPEGAARKRFLAENPELREYWEARRFWMEKNPDLVRFLTDDEKQLRKYERMRRNPDLAVPTAQEILSQMSPAMQNVLADYARGIDLPPSMFTLIDQLAAQRGLTRRQLLGILTGRAPLE